jgi:hypothetical protein
MKKLFLYAAILCIGTVFLSACEKNFLDVNNNPNSPGQADATLVFTNALTSTASLTTDFIFGAGPSGANSLSYFMNYLGLSSNYQIDYTITRNDYTSNDFTNVWFDAYHNLNDYNYVEQTASGQSKWFLVGAAKVMKALDFHMLVDCYNDIPYTDALTLATTNNATPKYDKAQDIYNALITELDSAVSIFENSSLLQSYNPGSADVMFGGSASSWAQFANTLKLRMLLHEVNASGQLAMIQAEMQKISNDPNGLLGAGQSALINPGYASDAQNHVSPFYYIAGYTLTYAIFNPDQTANTYFINKLTAYNDTRLGYFYNSNGGSFTGNPFGTPNNSSASFTGGPVPPNNTNLPFDYTLKPTDPTPPSNWGILQSPTQASVILPSWESLFLQAEAVQRGLLTSTFTAQQLYEQAITDNFTYLNVFTDGHTINLDPTFWASKYFGQNIANVGWNASTADPIQAIITQKYISLAMMSDLEAWTDFRRTGFPIDLPTSNDAARKYDFITRFIYPQGEYDTNGDNVKTEGTITPVSPKPFWMP